jgi:N-acetyltransferase
MNWQPLDLKNEWVELTPLTPTDFEVIYAVAKDPLIWEQHPNPDRYKRDVFQTYFQGAIASGGAFLIKDRTGNAIGCTRFYEHVPANREVKIGYTFFSRDCWGKPFNQSTKALMLKYAFQFVDYVIFHVGAGNIRSQKAMEKIGGLRIGEETVAYFGEEPKINIVYKILRNG